MQFGKRKFKGRDEFSRAWRLASREVHLALLSKPSPRQLQPHPDPAVWRSVPYKISKATLNHKPSRRLKLLSQPLKTTPKFSPPEPSEHYVSEHNLWYVPSQRIEELAQPRKLHKKKEKGKKVKVKKGTRKSGMKKKSGKEKSGAVVSARKDWLELRAAPKRVPSPPPIPKVERHTEPLSGEEREMRLAQLAQPSPRYLTKPDPWDPYQVSKNAQHGKPSKRTKELAEPRELAEETQKDLAFKPFTVNKGALKYKITKRMLTLSEPVVHKKAAEMDLKEDAFTVPKRALKAVCSKRTKELARPIQRKGWD